MTTDYANRPPFCQCQSTATHQTENKTDRERSEDSLGGILSNVFVSILF
jgi:hypothetical protein